LLAPNIITIEFFSPVRLSFSRFALTTIAQPTVNTSPWSREHPYLSTLHNERVLTSASAMREVRHVELDLGDSGLHYLPGDTVAVHIRNDPALVDEILALAGLADAHGVLREELLTHYEITQAHPGFFKHYGAFCPHPELQRLLADSKLLRAYMEHRQIVDVMRDFPTPLQPEQLASCLRHLQPRQYSIASSQQVLPTRVALTVGMLRFDSAGHSRRGAASGYLAERCQPGDQIAIHIVSNPNFRLPEDPEVPVIMIGPGTGIAPFRAFLQERQASKAKGKNWLFFGSRHREHDFLYSDELREYQRNGLLTHLDLAFSREQADKVYVQQRMLEQAEELFAWLQQGAYLYVCGDAKHMAEDVQKALLLLVEQQGKLDAAAARRYLVDLRQHKRYQRDVY
jgi:sulfite reductase (NADPH) flavoprotein alpha-component